MTRLRASHGERTVTVQARPGATLREALEPTELQVRTGCNGNGSCGLCRVRVRSGAVSAPTETERLHHALEAGLRLACQTVALDDVVLEVEGLAPCTAWTPLPAEALAGPERRPAAPRRAAAARIALDVGTSNLNLALWNAQGSRRLAGLRGCNPQAGFGSDIMTRLLAARDPAVARRLAGSVARAVASGLQDLALDDAAPAGPCSIIAVGNTAMLALLRGAHDGLLEPRNWQDPAPWPERPPLRWDLFGQRRAAVQLVPPLGGFVGSDLLAAALAAGLLEGDAPALLTDFGTNTEIALWDGATLWVTSAAGGPAFEACGLGCGVPADPGAIFRVRPGAPLSFDVLGGTTPHGVCGTGLVDWIACLVRSGRLSPRGNLTDGPAPSLGAAGGGITLHKRDVDLFQRAKAAIGAGILVLLQRAGLAAGDLRRVVTTGLFGRGLDIPNAQALGLLPTVPVHRVEAYDNLALAGCEAMVTSPAGPRLLEPLRARARLINLARCGEFEAAFVASLFLEPMES
jgi:uncharacterized 2Fe-2S/4Fe-4S cluster protein (DUF4445 family)